MKFKPKYVEQNVNVSSSSSNKEFINGMIGFLLTITAVCFFFMVTTDLVIQYMPMKTEKAFNQKVLNVRNYKTNQYSESKKLNSILDELLENSSLNELDIQIKISNECDINAFAMWDYTIIITKPLLEKLENDDEIAFVIAHELGHFAHKDYLGRYGKILFPKLLLAIATGGDEMTYQVLNSGFDIVATNFSKEQEKNADLYALNLLSNSNKDPQAGINVMKIFDKIHSSPKWVHFMASHPHPKDRIAYMQEWIRLEY